jgi:hypothetical protein
VLAFGAPAGDEQLTLLANEVVRDRGRTLR